jgi:hypothetical protein
MTKELYISTDRRFFLEDDQAPDKTRISKDMDFNGGNNIKGEGETKATHHFIIPWFLQKLKRSIEENVNVTVRVVDPSYSAINYLGKKIVYVIPEIKLNFGFQTPQNNGATTLLTGKSDEPSMPERFTMITGYMGDNDLNAGIRKDELSLRDISSEIVSELMNTRKMENLKY